MNWKSFLVGTAAGAIGGDAVSELLLKKSDVSPEQVLESVKNQFSKNGTIIGSWIHMELEIFKKQQIQYRIYKGGISKNNDGKMEQYEFIADTSTGTILDIRS